MTTAEAEKLLKLYFRNEDHGGIGNAGGLLGATAAGSLYISLHTADPTETGVQTSSEATYGGYSRKAVGRTTGAWTVSSATDPPTVDNSAAVTFDQCTSGTNSITFFGVGVSSTGAGQLLFSGALTATLEVSTGITPEFAIGDLNVTAD
jgi:hypothetical protein